MSNPLAIFRKHQKILLAVFGVALMFAFTIGPIILQWMGPGTGKVENAVVVRLPSGDLRESDLQSLRNTRMYLRSFMRRINGLAMQAGATPKQSLGVPDSVDERSLVQTVVLSEKARDMGMVISDASIKQFLEQYTDNTMQDGDFARELMAISGGRMSQTQFFEAMRNELLALRFMDLFQRGLFPATPAASWDYYQRLNRQVKIQAVPFPVEKYLAEVGEPSEQEVEALYEDGKDRFPFPNRPDPGFRRRKKVALQYVQADLEKFLQEEMEKVTDEEIEQYYDENKEKFRNLALPTESDFNLTPDQTTTPAESETAPESDSPESNSPDTESPDTSDSAPGETDDSTTPPAEEAEEAASENPEVPASPEETTESSDGNADGEPGDSTEPSADEPTDDNADGAALGRLETKFVAAIEQESGESGDDQASDTSDEAAADETTDSIKEVPVDEEVPVDDSGEPNATEAADNAEAADDATASEDPTTEAAEPDESGDTTDPTDANEDDLDDLGDLPDDGQLTTPDVEQPEYKPLEEVADEIRSELATVPAVDRMDKAVNAVRSEMKSYQGAYIVSQVQTDDEVVADPPPPPNLQALASEHGLTAGTIPEVDILELLETDPLTGEPRYPISQAFQANRMPFAQLAFGNDLLKYQVRDIPGPLRDTTYLYWKTNEIPESTPTLDECRSEVVNALKMQSALPKAKEEANTVAEQLRTSNQSPKDAFRNAPDREVIEAGPFSWMTPGTLPYMTPQLTNVSGIRYAGPEFMRSVFSLQQGESDVTTDHPERVAYVVYLESDESDMAKLREDFFRAGFTFEIAQLGLQESRQTLAEWYADYEEGLGVKWEREPLTDEDRG